MTWQHLHDAAPTAAKEYQCYLCGRTIRLGEKHVYRVGRDDEGILTMRMHDACEALTKAWSSHDWIMHGPADFRVFLARMTTTTPT